MVKEIFLRKAPDALSLSALVIGKKKDIEILLEINLLVSLSSEHVGTVFSLEQKNVKHWHYTAMQRN